MSYPELRSPFITSIKISDAKVVLLVETTKFLNVFHKFIFRLFDNYLYLCRQKSNMKGL